MTTIDANDRQLAAEGLCDIGAELHQRGWSRATSSNYSVRLGEDPLRLLVTASGKHKDRLGPDDFVLVGDEGTPIEADSPKSSAETMLHVVLAQSVGSHHVGAGAILHTHSVWGTLLSDKYGAAGQVSLAGYEMLKAFPGVTTHDTCVDVAIFPNTQDIGTLAAELREQLAAGDESLRYGFLIHKHGLYTWGADLDEARARLEAFEFLFECEGRKNS